MQIDYVGIKLVEQVVEDLAKYGLTPYGFLLFYEDIQRNNHSHQVTQDERKEREALMKRWTLYPDK